MNGVFLLLAWNLAVTAMLAMGVWCLGWLPAMRRRPALRHGLWLLVLLKLVVPPLVPVPVLPAGAAPVSADRALDPVAAFDNPQASLGDADAGQRAIRSESAETANSAPPVLPAAVEGRFPASQVAGTSGVGWREALLFLAGISLTVSAALWLAALGQLRRVRRLLKNGPVHSGRVVELLEETARKFGLRQVPRLFLADAPVTPMLWADRGRPVIVLPQQLVGLVDNDQLRWILGHELAHCVRRDHLANLLAFCVISLFWWNPVAWLAWGELTSAAEAACDALALQRLAGSRKSYAETLLAVIDFMSRANSPDLAIGVGFGRSRSLKTRFAMLAHRGVRPGVSWVGWGVIALGAAALTLLPAHAEDPPKAVPAPAAEPLPKIDFPPARPAPPPADTQPVRSFEVTVGDANGRVVAGADVWFTATWSFFPLQELVLAGHADDAGHFRFSVPEAWLSAEFGRVVWAYAPGHGVGMAFPRDPREKGFPDAILAIQLLPASDLSVVVTLPNGKPAAGAKVAPLIYGHAARNQVVLVPSTVAERIGGVTDQQGRVRLPALARERARRTAVVHQGYGQQFFFLQQSSRKQNGSRAPAFVVGEPELRLRPAGRIEGRLIANQPELVSGIPIKVDQDAASAAAGCPTAEYLTGWGMAEVKTDAEGRFVIPEIAEGSAELMMKVDPQLPVRPRIPDIEVKGAETLKLEIPWEMLVRVHGTVRVKDGGEPLKANVLLEYGRYQYAEATTDEKGNYSGLVLPGNVRVFASFGKEKYVDAEGPRGKTYAVPKGVADFELPLIEAVPAIEVTGTLFDADGKRLAGAQVRGIADREIYDWHDSDEQGKFSLGQFPVGMTFDSFSIESGGERFDGKAESTDPLVVRLQPTAAQTDGTRQKR